MKILFLTEYSPIQDRKIFTGGVESRVYHASQYLKKRGHIVEIESRTGAYSFNSIQTLLNRLVYMLTQCFFPFGKKEKYDVVEGTNIVTYLPAFFRARSCGAKAVAWYPDVFIGKAIERLGIFSGVVAELIERIAVKLSWDGVIALSGETKRKLIENGVAEKKIQVIYGGADLSKFSTPSKFPQPTLLCIARLVPYKRVKDLLIAIYVLKRKYPDIRLIVVGNGPEKQHLFKLCKQLGTSSIVEWKTGVSEEEKWNLLRKSMLHVLPSVVEGFGLVTAEALASGTPVVNADISVNRELLRGSRGGLLYEPGDYVSLAQCIEKLLENKNLYNQKVREGEELVKRYDWDVVNKETESFYQRLLSH